MYCYFVHALNLSNSLTDVYEEVLEIVSYMTFFSPTISLDMWSLWPLMMEALNDWAIDFFESTSNFMMWHYVFCFIVPLKGFCHNNLYVHAACFCIIVVSTIVVCHSFLYFVILRNIPGFPYA